MNHCQQLVHRNIPAGTPEDSHRHVPRSLLRNRAEGRLASLPAVVDTAANHQLVGPEHRGPDIADQGLLRV